MLTRRSFFGVTSLLITASACSNARKPALTVYKTASCSCCGGWIAAMEKAGYPTTTVVVEDINPVADRHGVPFELSSCHLGTIGGYVAVGHVPPADVARLLREKPKALGVTVPGMPIGSPGMEMPDGSKEAYDTLLLMPDGKTDVFARHA